MDAAWAEGLATMTSRIFPRRLAAGGLAVMVLVAGGCAAYQVGPGSLYRSDIRTVHVPVFRSDTLRRDLGERLTEAVIKEIENRSPYKVTHRENADSVLSGNIVVQNKRVVSETINDDPRTVDVDMAVQVSWSDHRGNLLTQEAVMPLPPLVMAIGRDAVFVAEAGQSVATAKQTAIEQLAREIVQQMETPW